MSGAWNRKHGEWRPYRKATRDTVTVRFHGGPWSGGSTESDSLDPIKLVFHPDERKVWVYRQDDGSDYLYSAEMSAVATEDYDKTWERWGQTSFQVVTG